MTKAMQLQQELLRQIPTNRGRITHPRLKQIAKILTWHTVSGIDLDFLKKEVEVVRVQIKNRKSE